MTKPNGTVEEEIMSICNKYGFTPLFMDGTDMFFLKTPYSRWRVYYNGLEVKKLYHGNYWANSCQYKKRNKKFGEEFHEQNIKTKNMKRVISYIYYHDKNYIRSHNQHMDSLFAQIENKSRRKKVKIA